MTINQTLDKILTIKEKRKKLTNADLNVIQLIQQKLLKLKMDIGGNSENPDEDLEELIEYFVNHIEKEKRL
jgi:hypothetical protein